MPIPDYLKSPAATGRGRSAARAIKDAARLAGPAAVGGAAAAKTLTDKTFFSKLAGTGEEFFKGKTGKAISKFGPYALMAFAISQYMGRGGQEAQAGLQVEALERQTENIDPQAMMYQAMLQSTQQEEQFVQQQLVNRLMGVTGPALARGEERI